jgi:hypothetical protein
MLMARERLPVHFSAKLCYDRDRKSFQVSTTAYLACTGMPTARVRQGSSLIKYDPLTSTAKEVLAILRSDPQLVLLVFHHQSNDTQHPIILRGQSPVRRVHPAIFRELRDRHLIEAIRVSTDASEVTWALIRARAVDDLVA